MITVPVWIYLMVVIREKAGLPYPAAKTPNIRLASEKGAALPFLFSSGAQTSRGRHRRGSAAPLPDTYSVVRAFSARCRFYGEKVHSVHRWPYPLSACVLLTKKKASRYLEETSYEKVRERRSLPLRRINLTGVPPTRETARWRLRAQQVELLPINRVTCWTYFLAPSLLQSVRRPL